MCCLSPCPQSVACMRACVCTHALCKCQSVYPGSFYSLCPNNSRASRTPLPVIRIRLSDVHGLHTRVPRPRCCQITSLRPKTAGRASPSAKASPLTSISALRQSRERLFQETSGALTRVTCHPHLASSHVRDPSLPPSWAFWNDEKRQLLLAETMPKSRHFSGSELGPAQPGGSICA